MSEAGARPAEAPPRSAPVPFVDLGRSWKEIRAESVAAFERIAAASAFVLGEELTRFEQEFAAYCEAAHCVGVSDGTEAIRLALLALGIGPGDEVVTVPMTFIATIEAIAQTGARPVLVDVDPVTRCMDPRALATAIGPDTRAVVPVHLYGRPAPVEEIRAACGERGIALVEDAAQAHGGELAGRRVGSLGDAAAFSFYPTKNLGAYGDGGFVATNDPDVADRARLLRGYGWRQRYLSESHGINSRLDELQAAVLRVKLRHLDAANEERQRRARLYDEALRGVATPVEQPWAEAVYHLYVIESERRDALKAALNDAGIATDVHYPLPSHLQPATADLGYAVGSLPETERLAAQVLSLPMYPELPIKHVERVAGHVGRIARELAGKPR